jgi:glycosyltransferase involved in cell wall biosynthesis
MRYSMCLGEQAMPRITGTIIAFNEETRIAEAIASLACCDEILVVDSGSTDRTRDIAHALGARVLEREWSGYSSQKNFAAEQATNDWILSVDSDERVSMELADEIVRWKESNEVPAFDAWSMPRRAFYLGRWIKHSGWYPDRKVRLYDRRCSHWEGDFVHEWVRVNEDIGRFHSDLLHFPFRNWGDHEARIDRYTKLAAQAARSSGARGFGNVLKLIFGPPLTFIKAFVVRAGFLDGWRGLAIAYMGARYVLQREFRILR